MFDSSKVEVNMVPSSVGRLVQAGLKIGTFAGDVEMAHVAAGELFFPSGRLVVFDPQFGPKERPIEAPIPRGDVPVHVAVVRYPDGDERVAGAWLRLSETPAKRWSAAKPASLSVESGVVCFADATDVEPIRTSESRRRQLATLVEEAVEKNYKDTRSWGRILLAGKKRATPGRSAGESGVLFCSSGFGDGVYGLYLGYDAKGVVSHILTDFGLLLTEAEVEAMQDEAL